VQYRAVYNSSPIYDSDSYDFSCILRILYRERKMKKLLINLTVYMIAVIGVTGIDAVISNLTPFHHPLIYVLCWLYIADKSDRFVDSQVFNISEMVIRGNRKALIAIAEALRDALEEVSGEKKRGRKK
jgi:hypothetical protein